MDKAQNERAEARINDAAGFGARLKAAREEQGISLGDMEARSRLSVAQLKALEAENLALLPEPVYVRAFIRNVANVLRIDAAPLIADYSARYGTASAPSGILPLTDVSHEPVISRTGNHRLMRLLGTVVLLVALVTGAWYAFTDEGGIRSQIIERITGRAAGDTNSTATTEAAKVAEATGMKQSSSQSTTPMVAPAPVAPVIAPVSGSTAGGTPNANTVPSTPNTTPEGAVAAGASQAQTSEPTKSGPVEQPSTAATQTSTPVAATDNDKHSKPVAKSADEHQVVLRVSANSWIEVIGRGGERIFSREMTAGSSTTLVVTTGARFTIGNSPATVMTVDGNKFDVASHAKGAVARFELK